MRKNLYVRKCYLEFDARKLSSMKISLKLTLVVDADGQYVCVLPGVDAAWGALEAVWYFGRAGSLDDGELVFTQNATVLEQGRQVLLPQP